MTSMCKKVKNPCKICLGNVTRKSGIQCEGECHSWVHYKCLHFTPGKISDIKRGLIIVSCPCPDCSTVLPKEVVKDEPFSCTNEFCPANIPPKCSNASCPSNADLPPQGHNNLRADTQQMRSTSQFGPCTIDNCKTSKVSPTHDKANSHFSNKSLIPSTSWCISGDNVRKSECVTQTRPTSAPMKFQQQCPPPLPPCLSQKNSKKFKNDKKSSKSNNEAIKAMERMCTTMGELTCQLNTLMDKMQQVMDTPTSSNYSVPPPQTNGSQLPCCCSGLPPSGMNNKQSMDSCCIPPPCFGQDQQENSYSVQPPPCCCPSNPAKRNKFY